MYIRIDLPFPLEGDKPEVLYRLIPGDKLEVHDAKQQTIFVLVYPTEPCENCDELLSVRLVSKL